MTAMDVWMLSCMGFVASALLEFATLLWIKYDRGGYRKTKGNKKKEEVDKRCETLDRSRIYQLIPLILSVDPIYWAFG
jgi:hypothetical protein